MIKKIYLIFALLFAATAGSMFAQDAQFGQNKVQYKDFTWYYIQTKHFDIYFPNGGEKIAEFCAQASEDALVSLQNSFRYSINNRISIILYKSLNDFQETNVTDEYLDEGIGGFTELFKNRVVLPFDGSYSNFRHVIHHELSHAVINDMFYGGSFQNIISKNIQIQLPSWFNEGMAEYQSLGWDINTDMFIRDAIINEYLPDLQRISGYYAYRAGQSLFYYISQKYGKEKISEIVNKTRGMGDLEEAIKASIGLNYEELNERWKKDLKKMYWPDIATRDDPDQFAKKLTDKKKDFDASYNVTPVISPQGDKVAFITNKNFFFDVYIISAIDGKVIKRLVQGNRSNAFEQLNILYPGLCWSPDGKKIILTAKSSGYDVAYIIDVESEDRETLPIKLDGISSIKFSPDGKLLVFIGHDGTESDIYLYNMDSKQLSNLTNDVFTDLSPSWAPDNKTVVFVSDRGQFTDASALRDTFRIAKTNYHATNLYTINIDTKKITRLSNFQSGLVSSPIFSPDGKELLFISDMNGINNIYKAKVDLSKLDSLQKSQMISLDAEPITNSLNGIYQLSNSADGKKLVFSSYYDQAYNIFLMNNPFEPKTTKKQLEPTVYISKQQHPEKELFPSGTATVAQVETVKDTSNDQIHSKIFTGQFVDVNKSTDTTKSDYSRYVFGGQADLVNNDSSKSKLSEFDPKNNLDKNGNFYVNKYKVSFSPDLVYANAGYSTLYGLLGTTVLSFSDVLGNHRIVGVTSLQIDLKNSDYGLAYYYLANRTHYGIEGFHTARFVYLTRNDFESNLFRFRNYGAIFSASYPLNKFYRVDGTFSWINVSSENLDNPDEPSEKISYLIPSVSFVHDNVLWGYTSPIDGTRYNFTLFGNPLKGNLDGRNLSFYSVTWDYRNYNRFWYDNSFVFRVSGGYSGGANPQRFFIGGTDNWINRTFSTGDIPINNASDFAFLTPALPLRGYNYAEQIGTKYALMNLELRMPLIRYLVTGPIPILFQNILGVAFLDMGSAWTNNKSLKFFNRDAGYTRTQDLLAGTGFGARMFFLYFLLRFDVAWQYNLNSFSEPRYYFSLGADF